MAEAALMIPAAVTMSIMILLLSPTGCDAFTSFKPILSHETYGARKQLVEDQDLESEFLMGSHISRILADSQNFETSSTNNATQPATGECDRPPRYDSCLGEKRNNPPPENCGTYNRERPC